MAGRRAENQPLRTMLSTAGWTYESLARAVNAIGAENGIRLRYDRTSVAHWLAGSVPRAPVRKLIAEAFTRRLRRPVAPAEIGIGEPAADGVARARPTAHSGAGAWRGPPGEAAPHAVARLARLCGTDADPVRRRLLHESVFSVAALDVSCWREPRGGPSPAEGEPAGGSQGDESLRTASQFFFRVSEFGGRHARTALVVYLRDDVLPRLHEGAGSDGRRLKTEAAHLVQVLARMYADDIKHGAAQRYHRAAVQLAAEADAAAAYAVVLRGMGGHALELGHESAALELSRTAARAADGAPPGVHAAVQSQLALALARTGERHRATACLHRAEEQQERAEAAGPAGGVGPYASSRAALLARKGRALAALGDRTGAVAALRLSLDHRPATAHRSRALTQAEIASVLLRCGHLEAACTAWHRFLDDYLQLSSGRADRALAQLRTDLRVHARHPYVPGVLRRADAVAAASAGGRR